MKYGPFTLATTRPETKFGDTAIAVNPKDERYKDYVGKEIEVEGLNGPFKIKVIADDFVDPSFGTGVVKVTPAHDKNDFEAGKRHNLEIKQVIGLDGKMLEIAGPYAGLPVLEARKKVVEDMQKKGLMVKIDEDYEHTISVCYKGGHEIEPMVLPNWFIKVDSLKKPALDVVTNGTVKIYPKWRQITYTKWMEEMRDWPISRQIVWGIRIPIWYDVDKNPDLQINFIDAKGERVSGKVGDLLNTYSFEDIKKGLQNLIAPKDAVFSTKDGDDGRYLQETDTFDTWFSSGHWPLATLRYPDSEDFKYFYPTSVMETGWEIIRFWVSRMIMFGIYLTGEAPFKDVYLHGLVRDPEGKKMSKSLGNVIDPLDYIEEFGADALRMGLISGTANGRDFAFPKDKVLAYRNFANKLWNMARFMLMMFGDFENDIPEFINNDENRQPLDDTDKEMLSNLENLIKDVNQSLEKYRFADASEYIYQFMWHEIADKYIEHIKTKNGEEKRLSLSVLKYVYSQGLKLLHPFMPFVTESIWENLPKSSDDKELLIESNWPN